MLRCPLCAGLDHVLVHDGLLRCKLCSLGFRNDSGELPSLDVYLVRDGVFQFLNWNSLVGKIMRRPTVDDRRPFYFSPPTVRMFASQQGRHATAVRSSLPIVPIFVRWPYGRTIQAKIETPLEQSGRRLDTRLTLGIIAARDAWQEALDLCVDMADHATNIIVVLDTTDVTLAAKLSDWHSAGGSAACEWVRMRADGRATGAHAHVSPAHALGPSRRFSRRAR